jgi:hypothetical protein
VWIPLHFPAFVVWVFSFLVANIAHPSATKATHYVHNSVKDGEHMHATNYHETFIEIAENCIGLLCVKQMPRTK